MNNFIRKNLYQKDTKIGLWSSLNKTYYKHFETINDTFQTQLLNDHDNTCLHQALLMPRKDLGISDEEWIKKRDACWVQNTWSATITPKGAFFCEIAGNLDMLFDGPGGWKVEPNWWKRTPEEFADQLHWCELCSGCLDVPKRISNDERDDMTPQMYERLKAMGSPKIAKKQYVIHDPKTFDKTLHHTFTGSNDYMEAAGNIRTTNKNRDYYPKNFLQLPSEKMLPSVMADKKPDDWIILAEDYANGRIAYAYFSNVVINPGCVYLTDNNVAVFNVNAKSLRGIIDSPEKLSKIKNIWDYYPMDKIVKVKLADAFYEKIRADCIEHIPFRSNVVIFGGDGWTKKFFLRLMEDGLYNVCAWMYTQAIIYPMIKMQYQVLKNVDYIIIAQATKKQCDATEEFLKTINIPEEKILKFHPIQR